MAELHHCDDERTEAAYSAIRREVVRLRREGRSAAEIAAAVAFVHELRTTATLPVEYDNTPIQRLHAKFTETVDYYGTEATINALDSHLHDQRERE